MKRAKKLEIECFQSIDDKLEKIKTILKDLPQPDREYILELLKHWQRIR